MIRLRSLTLIWTAVFTGILPRSALADGFEIASRLQPALVQACVQVLGQQGAEQFLAPWTAEDVTYLTERLSFIDRPSRNQTRTSRQQAAGSRLEIPQRKPLYAVPERYF